MEIMQKKKLAIFLGYKKKKSIELSFSQPPPFHRRTYQNYAYA